MIDVEGLSCQELVELVTDYLEGALEERDLRAFERHLEHCGTPYVADELTTACEEARIFLAAERSADALA